MQQRSESFEISFLVPISSSKGKRLSESQRLEVIAKFVCHLLQVNEVKKVEPKFFEEWDAYLTGRLLYFYLRSLIISNTT